MIDVLFSGIWFIDVARVWGFIFLALLVFGIPLWMVASRIYWRRKDADEMARLLHRINPTDTGSIPKHRAEKGAAA